MRCFHNLNKALLSKWLWRFANERASLWRKVISSKFGEDLGGWCSCMVRRSFGIGVWKEIRKEWVSFFSNTLCSLGNGRRARFWKNIWCGEEPLFVAFPSVFAMAEDKEARVADMWESFGGGGGGGGGGGVAGWSPWFSRSFND